jgi:hypothetical protein
VWPFLPTEPLNLRDLHPLDAELGQRVFDLLELERFDDGFQFSHVKVNSVTRGLLQSKAKPSTRSLSNSAPHERKFAKDFFWRSY